MYKKRPMRKTYTQIANIGNYYDNISLVNLYTITPIYKFMYFRI